MNNEIEQNERERDAQDRLIDWGLRANAEFGEQEGQPSPGLPERILKAAASQTTNKQVVDAPQKTVARSSRWAMVVAATLVIGIGSYWAYVKHESREANVAKVSTTAQVPFDVDESGRNSTKQTFEDDVILDVKDYLTPSISSTVVATDGRAKAVVPEPDTNVAETGKNIQDFAFFAGANVRTTPHGETRFSKGFEAQKSGWYYEPKNDLNFQSGEAKQRQKEISVAIQGKDATLVAVPETRTRQERYTVMVPERRSRTVSFAEMVPEQRTNEKGEVYTVTVPQTKTREQAYTVSVPEERFRKVPYFVHVPKVIDSDGAEIEVDKQELAKLQTLMQQKLGLGQGPELGGDKYTRIHENPFVIAKGTEAVSTFSIDVDTASYSNVRQYLVNGQLPPPDAVRIEELVNYFDYDYVGPDGDEAKHPFATQTEVAQCPWDKEHRLVRIGIKGKEIARDKRPLSNLVFLVDVSGSMQDPNKLELVIDGLSYMTQELGENDRVAIVVYAGSEGLALPATRGDKHGKILAALKKLTAGGSTAGGAGVQLAYKVAEENFIEGGTNRVLLCTDGDFNVGISSTADLERLAEQKAKDTGVFLTALGFGRGNLNDEMMEAISNCGNGTYHYIDNLREARRVLVQQLSGTLVTIAKDVKIQVEFNPANVAGYRLLGYENRMLERRDFNDDTKDAGEVGAGHTVTALYEIVPAGVALGLSDGDRLKYQDDEKEGDDEKQAKTKFTDELLTLRLRYKQPDEERSTKVEFPVKDASTDFASATEDFRFASSVVGFGMLLRDSEHKGTATFSMVRDLAAKAMGRDDRGYRAEFLDLVDRASELK